MSDHPSSKKITEINIDEDLIQKSISYTNIAQEFIHITSDKIKLCLLENQEVLKAKTGWITPLGILIALIAALVTADFKKTFLGLKPEVWEALFIISSILCSIWLIHALCRSYKYRHKGGIEDVIKKLKQTS